jgi:PHD/YefM family antitoxin component YafN of YafNO toxin-antitoxin module
MRARESGVEYVVKKGQRKAVILPIEEYEESLEDLYDLGVIEQRKNEPTIPLAEVERRLKQRVAREKLK